MGIAVITRVSIRLAYRGFYYGRIGLLVGWRTVGGGVYGVYSGISLLVNRFFPCILISQLGDN